MSIPANPLDKYASYMYHFELHAAASWDTLKYLMTNDDNGVTDRFEPGGALGTLLINTRRDAHQSIDNVRFQMIGASASASELLMPTGQLTFIVTESGGFGFIEKLDALRDRFQVSTAASTGLMFLLKIFFVGRKPDNTIETLTAKLLPLRLNPDGLTAVFTERGGEYEMKFNPAVTVESGINSNFSSVGSNFAYTRRSISFSALTVDSALKQLEKKLNQTIEKELEKEGSVTNGKRLKYGITWDPDIKGNLVKLGNDSLAPNEPASFTSNPFIQIGSIINKILLACPAIQEKIAASRAAVRKEFTPGIFIPLIEPRIIHRNDVIEVNFHITVNRGGAQLKYEFDYYFADAGKNVDIISYEVKFAHLAKWAPTKVNIGYDWALNQSGDVPASKPNVYTSNIVTENTPKSNTVVEVMRSPIELKKNDPVLPSSVTPDERSGYSTTPHYLTPSIRLASETIRYFVTAVAQQQRFEIRGNIDLLNAAMYYPTGEHIGEMFGGGNIWVKINIYMPDSRFPNGKRQFYYTNWYRLSSIENTFSGGQFKQNIYVQMVPEVELK